MVIAPVTRLYRRHQRWIPIASFILGFIFDMIMLRRIDELKVIVQQAVYLAISGTLVGIELIETTREVHPPAFLRKVWKYREFLLDFMLGTLLNSYTIFYFKSASAFTSFIFIGLLVSIMILNEFRKFGKSQAMVHMAFLSLCLVSYLISLAPIILGFMGMIPFLCAVAASALVFFFYYRLLGPRLGADPRVARTQLLQPFAAVQCLFVVLYFAHAIPPVPLSVPYMGIYHGVEKKDGEYQLSYTRSKWKFWQRGDQTFLARPGDVIHCYAQIFSPSRFREQLQVRWLYRDPRLGWTSSDAIPMQVVGGREEGFRGVTKKSNYQPGEWRVQIETMDSQEVGRLRFTVEADASTEPRELQMDLR